MTTMFKSDDETVHEVFRIYVTSHLCRCGLPGVTELGIELIGQEVRGTFVMEPVTCLGCIGAQPLG